MAIKTFLSSLNDLLNKLPKWLAYPLVVLLLFCVPATIYILSFFLFSWFSWLILSILFLNPSVTYLFNKKPRISLQLKFDKRLYRKIVLTIQTVGSIVVALNYFVIQDSIGKTVVPGYRVTYSEDRDSYGESETVYKITSKHWFYTLLMYGLGPFSTGLLIFLFSIVYNKSQI